MSETIPFAKYSGCGNDFILIDNRERNLSLTSKAISRLCHRQHGIGADGIIFLEKGTPYRMRIFQPDGYEVEMCGNGIRCLAQFIHSLEKHTNFTIQTKHAAMSVKIHGDLVSVAMPPPAEECKSIELTEAGRLHVVDTGVPHAVMFVDDLYQKDLLATAPMIRHHKAFPKGTNVNYAKILSEGVIAVRTYERGVEGETLACGTGAVAVALAAAKVHSMPSPITIHTLSGDCLVIAFEGATKLVMTGPAIKIFEGAIEKGQ